MACPADGRAKAGQQAPRIGDAHNPSPSISSFPSLFPPSSQDVKDPDIKLGSDGSGHGTVTFRGSGEGAEPEAHVFTLDLILCGDIDPAASKIASTPRHIVLALAKKEDESKSKGKEAEGAPKKEEEEVYWPRLLAAKGKAPPNIKVDWDKWVDEDEEGAAGGIGGDFDFGDYGGMGGGGMGGGGMPPGAMAGMMGGGMGGGGMGGMDISQLLAGMGGGAPGGAGGGGFDVGSFPEGDDDDEEGEEADAPGAAPAEEVTA